MEAGIITKDTVGIILAKASAQADALKGHVKDIPAESSPAKKGEVKGKKGEDKVEPAPEQKDEEQKKEKTAESSSEKKDEVKEEKE